MKVTLFTFRGESRTRGVSEILNRWEKQQWDTSFIFCLLNYKVKSYIKTKNKHKLFHTWGSKTLLTATYCHYLLLVGEAKTRGVFGLFKGLRFIFLNDILIAWKRTIIEWPVVYVKRWTKTRGAFGDYS